MLEGGDPAIFTSDVSTEKGTYWISDYRLVRLLPCLVETNCSTFSDSRFKLIGNRWAWGVKWNASLLQGTQVSMATQIAATTTRHCHTEKLRVDAYQPGQPRGREGGQTAAQMHNLELETAWPSEQVHIIWNSAKTLMSNRDAWSQNSTARPALIWF